MKKLIVAAATACSIATGALAGPAPELSKPIFVLTPVIGKNADALNLTADQRANFKAWTTSMPAKRKAIETKAVDARAQLRQAIVAGAPIAERQALAAQVGELETQLVMMRSNCVDHWRGVLTPDQFAQAIALATAQ